MGRPRYIRRSVIVTTAADGSATAYLPDADGTSPVGSGTDPLAPLNGEVRAVIYTKTDFANTAGFTITAEETGIGVWTEAAVTASKTVHPLVPSSDQAGAPMLYAAAGEAVPAGPPILATERLKIVIATGGNAKTGTFTAIVG